MPKMLARNNSQRMEMFETLEQFSGQYRQLPVALDFPGVGGKKGGEFSVWGSPSSVFLATWLFQACSNTEQ